MKQLRTILLGILTLALLPWATPAVATDDVDIYTTPGFHNLNERDWRTTCEKYSQTRRCRTEIKATQITQVGEKFVSTTGWVFNNLTYVASSRTLWKTNPLGGNGTVGAKIAWTATDGRKWRTECDTSLTGRNGCRSFVEASVIVASHSAGGWTYRWVSRYIFNNIVRFTVSMPQPISVVAVPDTKFKACINYTLKKPWGADITPEMAATITKVDCPYRQSIKDLQGAESLTNVTHMNLYQSQISDLTPLKNLKNLRYLNLALNAVSDVTPLADITSLRDIRLSSNKVNSIAALSPLKGLTNLDVAWNEITDLRVVPELSGLTSLDMSGNDVGDISPLASTSGLVSLHLSSNVITDLSSLQGLENLKSLSLSRNKISDVSSLSSLTGLTRLRLDGNTITDVTPLSFLTDLEGLELSENQIADIAPLEKLVKLNGLYLASNNISSVTALRTLPMVGFLNLRDNPILDIQSLDSLIARGVEIEV